MVPQNDLTISRLDRINRLLALVAIRDVPEGDAIDLLSKAGYGNAEIAELVGITANAVGIRLHRSRKNKPKSRRKSARNDDEQA